MSPGNNLRRARKQNGYKYITDLAAALKAAGHPISKDTLGRLERDDQHPKLREIKILCIHLNMSADWWLVNDEAASSVITRKIEQLPEHKRRYALAMLDGLAQMED